MERFLGLEAERLTEAAFNPSKGVLTVTVIKPGFNKSKSRFYPSDMLKRDFKVFEGQKMFVNHQTANEEAARPEGDLNKWVGTLRKVWTDTDGAILGEAVIVDPVFKAKLETLNQNKMLGDMGVSIRALGEASDKEDNGQKYRQVERFLQARSVDFVTYPGAGGTVMAMESATIEDVNDVDLVTEAQLRERRPDLIEEVENKLRSQIMTEAEMKAAVDAAKAAQSVAEAALTAANAKIEASEKAARIAEASKQLTTLLAEAKLPKIAVDRLVAQFKDAEKTDGMKEAIAAEAEYIKSLGAPVSRKNGVQENGKPEDEKPEVKKEDMVKSYMRLGMKESEAKVAAGL